MRAYYAMRKYLSRNTATVMSPRYTNTFILRQGMLTFTRVRVCVQGLHPRLITEGFDIAKKIALQVLDEVKFTPAKFDRALLCDVARTSLRTKLNEVIIIQLCRTFYDELMYALYFRNWPITSLSVW